MYVYIYPRSRHCCSGLHKFYTSVYCFSGLYKSDINEMAAAAQNRYEPHSGGRTLLWANTDYEDNKVGNTEHPLRISGKHFFLCLPLK